ncbi:hypothetical protein [Dankookia sp. P2]|uniref:hypothetical protein n=1 Tax=Dankookia sp. P2 TaxID=3423955 RepID=UPI003D676BAA
MQGSVRRDAGRVRISAQLIDAASGLQVWGDRYDRGMGDIFALQDEVTRTIAATLGVRTQATALQRALTKKPVELDAYDCLLHARRYTWTLSAAMHAEARELLERAVELDPLSSDAHALLANVILGEHRFEMNPNDPEALADVGHYFAFMGEFGRGVELSRRAQQLNPLHPEWYLFSFARLHYSQRRHADVVADTQRIGMRHFYWKHLLEAAALGQIGAPDALAALARLFAVKPGFSAQGKLRKWNAAPDDLEHILDVLRQAGLRE